MGRVSALAGESSLTGMSTLAYNHELQRIGVSWACAAAVDDGGNMEGSSRRTGIDVIGDAPWGTHFCQFYEGRQDLIDILVPYLRQGLVDNEFCMWITSEPLQVEEATAALRAAEPNLDDYLDRGQIEILDYTEWYKRAGKFNAEQVLQGWVDKLDSALGRGFAGLRLTGNTFWLEKQDWADFTAYEEAINRIIGRYRMLAICTYALERCDAIQVMDVVSNHQFALVKRAGTWQLIESSEHQKTEAALRDAERRYRELVRHAPAAIYEVDLTTGRFTTVNEAMSQMLGYSREELLAMDPFDLLDAQGRALFQERIDTCLSDSLPDAGVECKVFTKDGRALEAVLNATFTTDEDGRPLGARVVGRDVTARRQEERRNQRYNRVLQGINRIFEQAIRAESEEALGTTCLEVALDVTQSAFGFVGEVGADGQLHDIAISDIGWDQCRMAGLRGHTGAPGSFVLRGLYGWVIESGTSVFTNAPSTHPQSAGVPPGHPPLGSFLGVPLIHEGRPIGILAVGNRAEGYGPEEQEDLEALAPAVVEALLRKRTERALRESEARFRFIATNVPDTLFFQDLDLRYVWIYNPADPFAPGDVVGKTDAELFPQEQAEQLTEIKRRVVETGAGTKAELQLSPAGVPRWYEATYEPSRDASGRIVGLVSYSRDITERKRAEIELRNERQLLQTIYDTIPVMLTIYDPNLQQITVNKHFTRVTGWIQEDTLKHSIMESAYPDPGYRREVADYMQSLQPGFRDIRMATKDGRTVDTSWANVRMPDGRQVGIGIGITQRKQAEEALERYTERLRFLHGLDEAILTARSAEGVARAAVDGIRRLLPCVRASVVVRDPDTQQLSLLAAYSRTNSGDLSKGWRALADIAGETALESLIGGRGNRTNDLLAISRPSSLVAELQAEGVRAQIYEPILIDGVFAGALNLGIDVPGPLSNEQQEVLHDLAVQLAIGLEQARLYEAVQRHADELELLVQERTAALEASEARFRTVFEEAAIGIALANAQGQLVATNPALRKMLGYSEHELAGSGLFDRQVGGDGDSNRLLQELLSGQRSTFAVEHEYVRKDGDKGEAILTVSLLRQNIGEPTFVLALMEDITERKRTQKALIQNERLAIMGRMAASLAHEINNPIQAVVGCLGLAMEAQVQGEDGLRFMEVAMDELRRAARIVHRLRDLGRRGEGRREPTSITELVERALVLTRNQTTHTQVAVTWEAEEDLPLLPVMGDRVQQVFLNLILNAIDAMPAGGELRIQATRTDGPPGVRIAFTDTGVGIAPEHAGRLFEAFHSTKQSGLGLGLYVSRSIIQEHGGTISVQSKPGHGSTFTVWLPAE